MSDGQESSQRQEKKPDKKAWKDVLLRSGVPLEYQVALALADKGYHVDADAAYTRRDLDEDKDHSIDILATRYPKKADVENFLVFLLVECKYRAPDKKLILFREPYSEFGGPIPGNVIYSFDQLVPFHLKGDTFVRMLRELPRVYKGVELHVKDAVERDFRRGVEQLRYAAPAILRNALDMTIWGPPADNFAIFFAKIVVTNAPIFVVHEGVDVATIQAADEIEQIAVPCDAAVLVSEYGPDFQRHCQNIFHDEKGLKARGKDIKKYLLAQGKKSVLANEPVNFLNSLCQAHHTVCREIGTQFMISSADSIGDLAAAIVKGALAAYKGRKKKSPIWDIAKDWR